MRAIAGIAVLAAIMMTPGRASAEQWFQFRGPRGDGHSEARGLPTTWGGFLEPWVWETAIPGRGWSSPVVVGDRIWLTSAEQTAYNDTELRKRLEQHRYGSDFFQTHATVTLLAIEVDAASGKILRQLQLFTCDRPAPIHATNSYASPTPVTDGQRLYCHFGSLGTVCVELTTGAILWKQSFPLDDITGPASSPVLWDDRLILACDGTDAQFVVALDKHTGEVIWRTPRPPIEAQDGKLKRAFSTPLVIERGGRTQLIAPCAQWIVSYNPADGAEWWRVRIGTGHALVPRPVFHDGLVYVCTGYLKPEMWALRVDGSGDVSDTHVVWRFGKQVPEISSPIMVGGEIFFVSIMGIATCLRAADGELLWQHRLEGSYAASPLAADGKLYFTSQEGTTTVLEPGPVYKELAKNQLFGQTLASPVVAGNSLIFRSDPMLYCVRKSSLADLAPDRE